MREMRVIVTLFLLLWTPCSLAFSGHRPSLARRHAAAAAATTTDAFGVGLEERSVAYLLRTYRNVKSMTTMTEKQLIMSPGSEEIMERAEQLAMETAAIEKALLAKLSREDPLPDVGQGSLARRELDLPPSRVMVTGSAGVLAALVFGKLQRATGTGAVNNVGLKHPNALCCNPDDASVMNRMLMGRFAGAGCWHENTQVQSTAAWDFGLDGVMEDFKLAVAGDERPFILVPRDGADTVVLGSRLAVKGTYKWGLSMALDHSVERPVPTAADLGETFNDKAKAQSPGPTHRDVFRAHVQAAAEGLDLDTQQRRREAARSSTRGPARHIFALVHPADCADAAALAATLDDLYGSAGGVPCTAVVVPPGVSLESTKLWRTRMSQAAGAPGRPAGEFLEDLTVASFPLGSDGGPAGTQAAAAAAAEAIAASGAAAGGVSLSQESYAELVAQLILLADAETSRVVVVAPEAAGPLAFAKPGSTAATSTGARIPAGVLESPEILSALRAAVVS